MNTDSNQEGNEMSSSNPQVDNSSNVVSDNVANVVNSGSLETLGINECLIYRVELATKTTTDGQPQFMVHFAEKKARTSGVDTSVLSRANRYDNRFKSGAIRSWMLWEPQAFLEDFGIDLIKELPNFVIDTVKGRQIKVLPLNILNPTFPDGKKLRIQIFEYVNPTIKDNEQIEKLSQDNGFTSRHLAFEIFGSTKKIPRKEGGFDFPTHKGQYILVNSTVVDYEPVDTKLSIDDRQAVIPCMKPVVNTQMSQQFIAQQQGQGYAPPVQGTPVHQGQQFTEQQVQNQPPNLSA